MSLSSGFTSKSEYILSISPQSCGSKVVIWVTGISALNNRCASSLLTTVPRLWPIKWIKSKLSILTFNCNCAIAPISDWLDASEYPADKLFDSSAQLWTTIWCFAPSSNSPVSVSEPELGLKVQICVLPTRFIDLFWIASAISLGQSSKVPEKV